MSPAGVIRAHSVPPLPVVGADDTALDSLVHRAEIAPEQIGFCALVDGAWVGVSYGEFLARARRLALGLIHAGVRPGDRVALMSRTRLEWALCDYAVWLAAGVTVPIDETSSAEQVGWALEDSAAVGIILETTGHAAVVRGLLAQVPALASVWTIDTGDLDTLEERGGPVGEGVLDERRSSLGASSLATIVYTSGTTGRPKGCAITHGNLVAVYSNTHFAPGIPDVFNDRSSTLLFLPLPGCEIGIDLDGEVLVRGACVVAGYWQNEVASSEAIDGDGWLRKGDIGHIDEQGSLSITGRKELLVTSGGKNVAPTVLEDRLRANELVSQCIVVGDARPYVACLLTIDQQALSLWRIEHGRADGSDGIDLRRIRSCAPTSSSPWIRRTRRCRRRRASGGGRFSKAISPRRMARSLRR